MTVKLYPITYRCPGGLRLTYNMTSKSYWTRFKKTWMAGVTLWRMWFREFVFLIMDGQIPYPTVISQNVAHDIISVIDRRLQNR